MRQIQLPVTLFLGRPLLFLAALSVAVCGAAETTPPSTPAASEPWPLENIEVQPSAAITWGRLENGLRYAILPHASPPGRVSMRLLVTAGSLNENDDERGYAHFVEHMAFNGTKHFPSGELVKFLQRQGAAFGPDVSATTSHTRTLYKLELPDNSSATLETGLRIFRDYADGILFEPAEVKRERGVILSEERTRHTPDEAKRLALTDLLYGGTLIAARQPLGLMAQVEHADAAALRKFYEAWYRPENMCVIVVGEIDAGQTEALLRTQFASLAGRSPARTRPDISSLSPVIEPVVAAHGIPALGFNINLIKVAPRPVTPRTWGTQLDGQRINAAFTILARRLEQLTQSSSQIINTSSTGFDVDFNRFRMMSVNVSSSVRDWEKALAIAEQEIRRLIEHGITPDELAYHQAGMRAGMRAYAQSLPTTPSADIAQAIEAHMEDHAPFAFTGENLDTILAMIDRLTAVDCQLAFREYWGEQAPHIFITTATEHIPTAEKIRAVYAASRKVAVEAARAVSAPVFGYEDFGPAGVVEEKKPVEDLDLWLVRFANGVRLNLKRTPFEKGLARFNVRIGTGSLSEPVDKPGLNAWAAAWFLGGVGKHTVGELCRFTDGLDSINVSSDDDALHQTGSARTEHLPRALRQVAALIADPAFRPEGHRDMEAKIRGWYDPIMNSPEGPVQRFVLPSLAGDHRWIGLPAPEALYARTMDELRAWITPQLEHGAIEVAVIGDFDVEAVIAEVAKTFGTLPVRQPKPAYEVERKIRFSEKYVYAYHYYNGSGDRPSTLEFYWPVRDDPTAAERRRLSVLAMILEGRVTEQVREKKGATYSPNVVFSQSDTFPGFAFIRCRFEVKPDQANHYGNSIRELAGKLAKKGITPDELVRAKAQHSAALQNWKTDNSFWLGNVLSDAQERPARLIDLRSAETEVAHTTIADINALARKYLDADQVFRYIIEPSARMPKQK